MMETIKLNTTIATNGRLMLDVATQLPPGAVEVVLVVQALNDQLITDTNGWPLGYFEATYGALADDPIERPEQLPLEERDLIE